MLAGGPISAAPSPVEVSLKPSSLEAHPPIAVLTVPGALSFFHELPPYLYQVPPTYLYQVPPTYR